MKQVRIVSFLAVFNIEIFVVLKFGTKYQKDLVCIDAVSGFQTMFTTSSQLCVNDDDVLNGTCTIKGALVNQCSTLLIPIVGKDETSRYVLLSKNAAGIKINDLADEWEDCEVSFENTPIPAEAFLPTTSEAGDTISRLDIDQYLEDSYNLLSAAAVLGCIKNRYDSALEVYSVKSSTGHTPILKTDLGGNHMAHLMTHIYGYESVLYAVAGKRPWSSDLVRSSF